MRSAFSGLCINRFATLPKQSRRLFYSNPHLLKPLKLGACCAIQWQVSPGLKHYWHRHTARAATLASSPMGTGTGTDMDKYMSRVEQVEEALGRPLDSGPQAPPPQPLVIVISGPSGVGKDAVIKRLQERQRNLHFVVTATTRTKRPGEVDGKDYYFLKRDEFLSLIEKDELLEHALVYGDYKGIPKQQIREYRGKGYDVLLRVDVQGAATLKGILEDSAVFIFLVAESEVALVKRLMERKTEYKDQLLLRISTAQEEMKQIKNFHYVVVNSEGQLDKTVELIQSIICAEKARVQQRAVQI